MGEVLFEVVTIWICDIATIETIWENSFAVVKLATWLPLSVLLAAILLLPYY